MKRNLMSLKAVINNIAKENNVSAQSALQTLIEAIRKIGIIVTTSVDSESPFDVIIESRQDLKGKLQKGLDDIKENKVNSLNETFSKIEKI